MRYAKSLWQIAFALATIVSLLLYTQLGNLGQIDEERRAVERFLSAYFLNVCRHQPVEEDVQVLARYLTEPIKYKKWRDREAVLFGLEAWRPQHLREAMQTAGEWSANLQSKYGAFTQSEPFTYNKSCVAENGSIRVKIFLGFNPLGSSVQLSRLARHGQSLYEHIELFHFGERAAVIRNKEAIAKHFFRNARQFIPNNEDLIMKHDLATYGYLELLQFVYWRPDVSHALYLETDAIPVYNFKHKYDQVLCQISKYASTYDIVTFGTCLNHHNNFKYEVLHEHAPNLALHNLTRCFNAVLIRKSAVRRILSAGAMHDNFLAIDHLVNNLTVALELKAFHVLQPLFYEESKAPLRLPCKQS